MKRVKTDANGQGNGGNGVFPSQQTENGVGKEVAVFEYRQIGRQQHHGQNKHGASGFGSAVQQADSPAACIGDGGGCQHQHDELRLAPTVEKQGENQQNPVAPDPVPAEVVQPEYQRQKGK